MVKNIFFIFFVLMPCAAHAFVTEHFDFSGYLEKRESRTIKESNDLQASEILFRGEVRKNIDNALLFLSFDFMDNHFTDETSKLHEAYFDYMYKDFSLRGGKQIIIKGNCDGFRLTDIVSPVDSTEFITRSFDETRMAVNAINLSYNRINYSLNFLYIPKFEPAETPDSDSPWFVESKLSSLKKIEKIPDTGISDSEIGGELKFFLPGIDFSFSYFKGYSDNPVYQLKDIDNQKILFLNYKKEHVFGFNFSWPVKDFVLRGESVFVKDFFTANKDITKKPVKTNMIKSVAGIDYYPGSSTTLSLQFYTENIVKNAYESGKDKSVNIITLSASKKIFREKLNLSSMIYFNPQDNDSYLRLSSDYEFTNYLKGFLGADCFFGSKNTMYGKYEDNSQIWAKLKLSF